MKTNKPLILASGSPRRKEILAAAGFTFEVKTLPTNEDFPSDMEPELVPAFLAKKKVEAFIDIEDNHIIIGADTVVILDNHILNKPQDHVEAHQMLASLSGKTHKVVTGVCIRDCRGTSVFSDTALVTFAEISETEIQYYIDNYRPFDKAGAYGVQDFIGMIAITQIVGSFYTVMGLPIHLVYDYLKSEIIYGQ